MPILKRHKRAKSEDLESGPSPDSSESPTASVDKERAARYEGEEYDVLLRYAQDQAALANKQGEDDNNDDKQQKRLWYAPWKKVKVESDQEKKVRLLFCPGRFK
jgi:H+-transporting ATPase